MSHSQNVLNNVENHMTKIFEIQIKFFLSPDFTKTHLRIFKRKIRFSYKLTHLDEQIAILTRKDHHRNTTSIMAHS